MKLFLIVADFFQNNTKSILTVTKYLFSLLAGVPRAIAKTAPYWGMLRNLSNPIKLELVVLLSESMEDCVAAMTDETEEERKVETNSNRPASVLADRNNAMLDAALAEFSGDFGGNADAL